MTAPKHVTKHRVVRHHKPMKHRRHHRVVRHHKHVTHIKASIKTSTTKS
jgi:hypothetical protein